MPRLSGSQARAVATAVAAARVAIGVGALVAPELLLRPWAGSGERGERLLARAIGGRDLALGLGALLAMRHDSAVRGWVEAGGLADAVDAAVTAASWSSLPRRGRWVVLGAAGAGAVSARVVSRSVDDAGP